MDHRPDLEPPDLDPPDLEQRALGALLARQRHSWEQGLLAAVLDERGEDRLLRVLAADALARQLADGRLAELDATCSVNSGSVGEVLATAPALRGADRAGGADGAADGAADRADGAGDVAAAVARQRAWLLHDAPRAVDGTLFHLLGTEEVWADSVFMVVPFLLATGDVAAAGDQLEGHRERLRDAGSGLWSARWDEREGRLADARHWGTANAWVCATAARALRRPVPAAVAGPLATTAREVLDACLARRRDDGAFGDVVDDPASFPESTLPLALAYAACSGSADGWLPSSYADAGRDLLDSAAARVDVVGQVTGAAAAPRFDRPGTSPEAQAFLLLARSAARRAGAGPLGCDRLRGRVHGQGGGDGRR